MKNRKLLLIVSLVLALTMSLGGTLAYLQDTDEAVNVMTLGNVKIEQHELKRKAGVDYKNSGEIANGDELVPFEDGKPLYPAYYNNDITNYTAKGPNDEQFWWGSYVTDDVTGDGSSNGLWDDDLVGAIDKFVFVENKGTSDCYYRTIIAFECPEGVEYSEGYDKQFMMNVNQNSRFTWEDVGYTEIEGVRYLLMVATYNQPLKAGKISRPSLLQVVMTHNATNEDVLKMGDTYEILVFTQAMQTKNFESMTAAEALDIVFGEITTTNHPWTAGVEVDSYDDVIYVRQGDTVSVTGNGDGKIWRNILAESGEFAGVKNLVIGEGVTTIGNRALRNSTTLESVVLPSTLTTIESGAFMGCVNLKNIVIPNSVTTIGDAAFRDAGLTEIAIPASITSIEANAFRGTKIKTLTIPATVKTIGEYAFRECTDLQTIYIEGTDVTFVGSGIFSNVQSFNNGNITVYVQSEEMKTAVEAACATNASGVVTVIVK